MADINPKAPAAVPLDNRGLPRGYPFKPDWEITPREVAARRQAGEPLVLLDCRRPEEWQAARIEGATWIPMGDIERRADELEDDEGGRARPIVVYCHHGNRSLRVAAALRAMGFGDVRSMAGGIDVWAVDVDQAIRRY